jgi:hypothetical protein
MRASLEEIGSPGCQAGQAPLVNGHWALGDSFRAKVPQDSSLGYWWDSDRHGTKVKWQLFGTGEIQSGEYVERNMPSQYSLTDLELTGQWRQLKVALISEDETVELPAIHLRKNGKHIEIQTFDYSLRTPGESVARESQRLRWSVQNIEFTQNVSLPTDYGVDDGGER